jgi:hypothetical protein
LSDAETKILESLNRLHARLDGIEAALAGRSRRPDRGIVPWREAATALGVECAAPARAAARRLKRAAARPGGEVLRLSRSGAERSGFERWLTNQFKEGDAATVRRALEGASAR